MSFVARYWWRRVKSEYCFFHFSESKHCIMGVVSGFELDDKKIYRMKKIEIISSTFWSKDEYLMYLVDKEWKEIKVWISRVFFDEILKERRKDNVNIYRDRSLSTYAEISIFLTLPPSAYVKEQ